MMSIQKIVYLYFRGTYMTNVASNSNASPTTPATSAETRQIVLKEVGAKWGKFSEQDLSALKNKDDLVTQVVAKYSLDKAQAQRDVDILLKGRQI
jgi:hypothetical protein